MKLRITCGAFAALALAACGGSSSHDTSKLSGSILDSIQRSCDKSFDCESTYDPSMHGYTAFEDYAGGKDAGECFDNIVVLYKVFNGQSYFDDLDASVAAGRITYNEDDYLTCVAGADDETCDQLFDQDANNPYTPPAECSTYVVSTVAANGSCTINEDCASGTCNFTAVGAGKCA